MIIEDLSIPAHADVFKPEVTWSALPPLVYDRLNDGGAAVFNLLPPSDGSWASGMIGISTPNCHLKSFQKKIEQGWILLMVDVPKDRVREISAMIRKNHPGIHRQGIEPDLPAFP